MLSKFQKEQRKKSLGASDMAAVLGINKFRSAYDCWLEKTGKIPETDIKSEAIEAGNRFERGVLAWASQSLGPLRRNLYLVAEGLPLHAILDARVVESEVPVEAKTAGLFSYNSDPEEWGPDGSDVVPESYLIQCQVQMICSKKDIAFLAAFIARRGFALFSIQKNEELHDIIKTAAVDFWEKNILADIPPVDSLPSTELAAKRWRVPEKLVGVSDEVVKQFLQAREERDLALERFENAKAMAFAALGDAEGSLPSPIGQLTCLEQNSPGSKFDEARLKTEDPNLWEKYKKPDVKIRILRYKKVKVAKV